MPMSADITTPFLTAMKEVFQGLKRVDLKMAVRFHRNPQYTNLSQGVFRPVN